MGGCGKKEAEQQVKKEIEISEVTVDEKENVDAFEDLTVEFDGWSAQGTITVNTDNCRDKVKNNIKFEYDTTQNGTLSNDDIITVYASVVGEGITLTKESCEYTVGGLRELNNVENFSDGVAWYTYTDTQEGKSYLACMDSNGNTLFQFENCLSNHTCFMNDRAMIVFEDGVTVGFIDKSGEILKTIDVNNLNYICDEYLIEQEHISDFDNNYYIYTIYNNIGDIIYKQRTEEEIECMYLGDDVFALNKYNDIYGKNYGDLYFVRNNRKILDTTISTVWKVSLENLFEEGYIIEEAGTEDNLYFVDSSGTYIERLLGIDINPKHDWIHGKFSDGVVVLRQRNNERIGYYDYENDKFVEGTEQLGDYMEKIDFDNCDLEYSNGVISFCMRGDDGKNYVASFDKNWELVFGPIEGSNIVSLNNGFRVGNTLGYEYYNTMGEKTIDYNQYLKFDDGIAYIAPFQWIGEDWNTIFDTISIEEVPVVELQEMGLQKVEHNIVGKYKGEALNDFLFLEESGKMKWVNSAGEEFESEYYKENDMWVADLQIGEYSITMLIMQDESGNLLTYGEYLWGSEYYRKQ